MMNVVFMGTPDFALPFLSSLAKDPDVKIQAVVTQEDKKVGRKQILTSPPVKSLAQALNLPVFQPASLKNNDEFLDFMKELRPDFIVVIAYGKILPKALLDLPRYGCLNVHPSLLPRYRGATPIESALLHGDRETGIAFMRMDEGLDTGAVYYLKKIPIEVNDRAETLRLRLSLIGAELLSDVLHQVAEAELRPIPQQDDLATYSTKIESDDGLIDPSLFSAEEIRNRIRAYSIWPQAYLRLKGKRLKILEAEVDMAKTADAGSFQVVGKDRLALGTRQGLLFPLKVQLEGKGPMAIDVFLRGNRSFLFGDPQ